MTQPRQVQQHNKPKRLQESHLIYPPKHAGFKPAAVKNSSDAVNSPKSPRIAIGNRSAVKSPRSTSEQQPLAASADKFLQSKDNEKQQPSFDAVAHVMALDHALAERLTKLGTQAAPYAKALAEINALLSEPFFRTLRSDALNNLKAWLPQLTQKPQSKAKSGQHDSDAHENLSSKDDTQSSPLTRSSDETPNACDTQNQSSASSPDDKSSPLLGSNESSPEKSSPSATLLRHESKIL